MHNTTGYPRADVCSESGRSVAKTWGVCSSQPKSKEQYELRTALDRANARRIVACWNACIGISTENLEAMANLNAQELMDSHRTGDRALSADIVRSKP